MMKTLSLLLISLIAFANLSLKAQDTNTFANPILTNGADPYAYYHSDGNFYFMATRGDRLNLWQTKDITQIANVKPKTIWMAPPAGPNSCSIWAPEIHYLNGKWFIYYSAADKKNDTDAARHIWVLENSSANPMEGEWIDRGQINTHYTGIDGSIFEANGKIYFLYSAYVDNHSDVMIAEMQNPWTLKQPEVDLAAPKYSWEQINDRSILEGPIFLGGPGEKVFIVFSASACWDDHYALGLLTASGKADLLNPTSWSRSEVPVFEMSVKNSVYGPGHNGFFKSPDGNEDWIIYHGKNQSSGDCAKRSTRTQKITWKKDGTPDFGIPVSTQMKLQKPSGE